MATNDYHFITVWRVGGTVEEIMEILANGPDLARWWPSVYLDVQELVPGDESGLGKDISLYTKGWLPYTLRWSFRVSDVRQNGFTIEASGDFEGRGIWTFVQDGPEVVIIYDWKIRAHRPMLRSLSFLLKPIFAANHRSVMAQGETSLKLELARRRARTPAERAQIPPPPRPTTLSPLPLLAQAAALGGLVYVVTRRRRREKQ